MPLFATKEEKEAKLSMKKLESLAEEIRKLRVQAATAIAVQSLEGLRPLVESKGFGKEFETAADLLIKTRPTGISLFNALEILKKERNIETLDKLLSFQREAEQKIASIGSDLIESGARVLTHCHSTTVVALLKAAKPKLATVYVTETRPVLQGLTTAKELISAEVPVVYCVDSAVGWLFEESDIDFCVVGADAVKPSGVINKLGTHQIAAIADDMDVPFYVATNTLKFDYWNRSVIEMRPTTEVIRAADLPGAKVLNPAFDSTPWKYITGVITERGVLTRNQAVKLIKQGFSFT